MGKGGEALFLRTGQVRDSLKYVKSSQRLCSLDNIAHLLLRRNSANVR